MREHVLAWVLIGCLVALLVRSLELQIIRGADFSLVARQNATFSRMIPSPRGVFFDRKGRPVVRNAPVYKVATEETKHQSYPEFTEVSREEGLLALQQSSQAIVVDQKRIMRFGEALSHVVGYVGEVSREELGKKPDWIAGYSIGRAGLERIYQDLLAGVAGREMYETIASGKLLDQISVQQPISGKDVSLFVDAELSVEALRLLNGNKGAVVILNPQNGEVLSMVSSPSYAIASISAALQDERAPLLNRAIHAAYPPGSIFKMLTGIAAIETHALSLTDTIEDTGTLRVGDFEFRNWFFRQYGRTDGELDLIGAIRRSNDIYFYKAAELAGISAVADTATRYGLGQQTGIILAGERAGLVPTPTWKQQTLGERWYLGNTYHVGIGQGDLLLTPLQAAVMTGALATGTKCVPRLSQLEREQCVPVQTQQNALDAVKEGMKQVCEPGGTAYPFFDGVVGPVAGKTGTAEFGPADEQGRRSQHAWFVAFTPVEEPAVALAVFVEGSLEGTELDRFKEGSRDAAPIAKELLLWMRSRGYF